MRRYALATRAGLALLLASWALAGSPAARAQDHGDGHSEVGQVHFPTSCSPAAQEEFERGVALLHSFWFAPAREAFTAAVDADPACAMGYWGIAMTWIGNPLTGFPPPPAAMQAGWAAVERALATGTPTQRERGYVAAVAIMFRNPEIVDHTGRTRDYAGAMEQLYGAYPDDREAAIFYALALNMTWDLTDKAYATPLRAAAVLEEVFQEQPQHPGITHYLIHSYDYPPIAQHGLSAAFRYAGLAPAAPHAQHMPSHIFTRVGYWQESVGSNLGARAAALAQPSPDAVLIDSLHPMDYLMYAYLQLGQDERAGALLDEVLALERVPANAGTAYALAAIPARWAVERHRWAAASRLALHPTGFPWERFPQAEALIHFARGLGAARSGETAAARRAAERLGELRDTLAAADQDYWAEQTDIQREAVLAWVARAEGRDAEALELMRRAAEREDATEKHIITPGRLLPARELLGEMLLELARPEEALAAFEASQGAEPNRLKGLYGAARAAQLAGDVARARAYFMQLLELAQQGNPDRPELQEARAFTAR